MPMPGDACVLCCSGLWTQDASWALVRRSRAAVARGSESVTGTADGRLGTRQREADMLEVGTYAYRL